MMSLSSPTRWAWTSDAPYNNESGGWTESLGGPGPSLRFVQSTGFAVICDVAGAASAVSAGLPLHDCRAW